MVLSWTIIKQPGFERRIAFTWWGELEVYADRLGVVAGCRERLGAGRDASAKVASISEGVNRCEDFHRRYHEAFCGRPLPEAA